MNAKQLSTFAGLGLLGGAFLPWLTAGSILGQSFSMTGIEGDGVFSAAAGFFIIILALRNEGEPGKRYSVSIGLLSIIALLFIGNVYINVSGEIAITDATIFANIGIGLYLSALAGIVGIIGGFSAMPGQLVEPKES